MSPPTGSSRPSTPCATTTRCCRPRSPAGWSSASPCRARARRTTLELGDLTERELEVLTLVARGLSNAELADELVVSLPTVKTHVGRVLMKLDARDRVWAVIFAYETGLIRPGGRG